MATALLLVLAGCGGDDPSDPGSPKPSGNDAFLGEWSFDFEVTAKLCDGELGASTTLPVEIVDTESGFVLNLDGLPFQGSPRGEDGMDFTATEGNLSGTMSLTYDADTLTGSLVTERGAPQSCTETQSIVATRRAPFAVLSTDPANDATDVALSATPSVTFNRDIYVASVNGTSVVLRETGGGEIAGIRDVLGGTVTFIPSSPLAGGTNYTLEIATTVLSVDGKVLAETFSTSFTTLGDLMVVGVQLGQASGGVRRDTSVAVTFNKNVNASTVSAETFFMRDQQGSKLDGSLSVSGATATFDPAQDLEPSTGYSIVLQPSVQSVDGASLVGGYEESFFTVGFMFFASMIPQEGSRGIRVAATVTAIFNKILDATTVNANTIVVTASEAGSSQARKTIGVQYLVNGSQVQLTPTSGTWPEYESVIQVYVSGVESVDTEPVSPDQRSFTTILLDPNYTYEMHSEAAGAPHLEFNTSTDEAYGRTDGQVTDAGRWFFEAAGSEFLISSAYAPAAGKILESGDGTNPARMDPEGPYQGQIWTVGVLGLRPTSQGSLESAFDYRLVPQFPSDKVLALDLAAPYFARMVTPQADTREQWWFKRAGVVAKSMRR